MNLTRQVAIRIAALVATTFLALSLAACNSSSVSDLIDAVDPDRKPINRSILGTNAFASDARFGTPRQQLRDIRNQLGIRFVRVLFAWNDAVQPGPNATPNFGLYDDIVNAVPDGMDILVILTGVPSWASNPANQVNGNIRQTVAERWVRAVATRYQGNSRIIGYQIWNEPNTTLFPENITMGFVNDPVAYVELLAFSHSIIKSISPNALVLNAATTAINQNFPESLDYNRAMRDAGALSFVDRWAIHYYGKQFENVVRSGGVEDFLNGLGIGIWVTESGAQGVNSQLAYGEQVWPFLQEEIGGIERIYQYQYAEATPSDVSYGMRTLDPAFPVSDLYVFLRDNS